MASSVICNQPVEPLKGQSGELPHGCDADVYRHGVLPPDVGQGGVFLHGLTWAVQACGHPEQPISKSSTSCFLWRFIRHETTGAHHQLQTWIHSKDAAWRKGHLWSRLPCKSAACDPSFPLNNSQKNPVSKRYFRVKHLTISLEVKICLVNHIMSSHLGNRD